MKIAIVMAMVEEAQALIDSFHFHPVDGEFPQELPQQLWEAKINNNTYFLIINGKSPVHGVSLVATQAAVLSTYLAVEQLKVDMVISAGTAGGFQSRGAQIADVYLAEKAIFHDRRVAIDENWQNFAIGNFSLYCPQNILKELHLKTGIVSTGNSLDMPDNDKEFLNRQEVHIKEMEVAAIAEVCSYYNVKCMALKSITDLVDGEHPTTEEFMKNLRLSSEALAEKLISLCKLL